MESRDERRLVHVFVTFLESNDMLRTGFGSSARSESLRGVPGFQERSESPPPGGVVSHMRLIDGLRRRHGTDKGHGRLNRQKRWQVVITGKGVCKGGGLAFAGAGPSTAAVAFIETFGVVEDLAAA